LLFKALVIVGMSSKLIKYVFWNFSGGIISGIALIFITPFYIKLIGIEAYGILSIWLVLQVLMGFLDFGLGPTIVKEFAKINHENEHKCLNLFKTAEVLLVSIAFAFLFFFLVSSDWIGAHWLKKSSFDNIYLSDVIKCIAFALAFQFPSNVYINALTGLQEHQRVNIILISSNLLKYIIGAAVLYAYTDLRYFFVAQAFIALAITLTCRYIANKKINSLIHQKGKIDFKVFAPIWRFSFGMALTSFAAVLLANVDRIFLSILVSAEALGKYSVAFTATGILQLAIQPFYKVYFPRYSELVKSGESEKIETEYFQSCQIMAAFIISIAIVGIVFAPSLFRVWLGSADAEIIIVFRVLLFSITCSGLMWLPSALQQAYSWTSLHLKMILAAILLGIPLLIFSVIHLGVVGGAAVWLLHGLSEITLGLGLMHRKILVGMQKRWYLEVLFLPIIIALPVSIASNLFIPNCENALLMILKVCITGIFILLVILLLNFKKNKNFSRTFLKINFL
jgi:O-antigen/teichoic acid export membrane protein